MSGNNTGVHRIDGLFLIIKTATLAGTIQGLLVCGHLHNTLNANSLHSYLI